MVPAGAVLRWHEELHLHLLELAGAENEITRGDLVAERFADLGDAERWPLACRPHHVGEVHEHALSGLRAQVHLGGRVGDGTGPGGEHEIELPGFGEYTPVATGRADIRVREPVGAVACAAGAAVRQRVAEVGEMAGRLPHRPRRQNRCVQAHHIVAELHHRPPPLILHVAQQQHPEGAVVVSGAEPPVDLRRLEHEAPSLGQVDDPVEESGVGWECRGTGRGLGCGRSGTGESRIGFGFSGTGHGVQASCSSAPPMSAVVAPSATPSPRSQWPSPPWRSCRWGGATRPLVGRRVSCGVVLGRPG